MRLDKLTESIEIPQGAQTYIEIGRGKELGGIKVNHDISNDIGKNVRDWVANRTFEITGIKPYPDGSGCGFPSNLDKRAVSLPEDIKIYDVAKRMYEGEGKSLGLKDIHAWKRNPEYYHTQVRQQAGYAAEIIGTEKDNIAAKMEKSGLTTYRADDLPGEFKKNDQLVDKVRKNAQGQIVERIQVKFVGGDGAQCLKKLASPEYGKYFEGKVDKIEIPSDYYDEIFSKNLIRNEISNLERQLEHAKSVGKTDVAAKIQSRINRYQKIQKSLLRSRVSSSEARQAVIHPRTTVARLFAKDIAMEGLKQGGVAAGITAAVSTVENVKKVMDGKVTPMEAFGDVAKKTAIAGGIGTSVGFISETAARAMTGSSHQLIKSMGNLGVPAAVISIGIDSYDSIVDYSRGTIDGKELAYNLGASTAKVTGAMAGAKAGAALGTVLLPGAGTVAGAAIGLAGGYVGTAVASQAYKTAIEMGKTEEAKIILEKTKEIAKTTVDQAKQLGTEKFVANTAGGVIGSGVGGLVAGVPGAIAGGILGAKSGEKVYRATQKFLGVPSKAEVVQKEFNEYFVKNGIPITV